MKRKRMKRKRKRKKWKKCGMRNQEKVERQSVKKLWSLFGIVSLVSDLRIVWLAGLPFP